MLENALLVFKSDTRTIETAYTLTTVQIGPAFIALPKLVAFAGALVTSALLLSVVTRTNLGRAIRAVAKEKHGARLQAVSTSTTWPPRASASGSLPRRGGVFSAARVLRQPAGRPGFVLVAFTIVVLGGIGSFAGALVGGLLIGVVESIGGSFSASRSGRSASS